MRIIVVRNEKQAAKKVAFIVSSIIRKKPNCNLGLASGRTMIPLYKELVERKLDFSKVKTFNLDEYIGLKNNKKGFHSFMDKNLFNNVNIKEENVYFPENKNYDGIIKKSGGIDLQILGIGKNGHIGFNEPGSSLKSKTRKVKLSKETKKANKVGMDYAWTAGIKTIMDSKKIILLAFGREKAGIIKKTLEEKITKDIPASFLRKHKNIAFIVDKDSAKKLNDIKTAR